MILSQHLITRLVVGHVRHVENLAEVQTFGLPVADCSGLVEQIRTTDQLVEVANTELGHDLACFFGDEEEIIHDVLRLALELCTQYRILRCHTHRAGVQMAFTHHDATFHHQRRRRKTKLICTKQCADHDIATGLDLTIGLNANTAAQSVEHQRLLRLCQTQFPRRARVLDRRQWRRTRAAIMTRDDDVICFGFCHASGDCADADFGDQLDGNSRRGIDVLEIVNQLRKIFDRVNIMMRRWRNQTNTRHREAQFGDVLRDLVARQLTTFAGLGALRHLDLNLFS